MKLDEYYPEIITSVNVIAKFNIKNINDLSEVQDKIYAYYKDKYISIEKRSRPIINIETGMKIEIWKKGILETFGNHKYYKNLSQQEKKIKLSTLDSLAKMIKYGKIRSCPKNNNHNSKSKAIYHYLKHPIIIDGIQYIVNIDIRKVPNEVGRFYIHSIKIKIGASKD